MNAEEMKLRTKKFSLRVIRLVESLPVSKTGSVIGHQLLRSATSVGANYRSACRARSRADFLSKIGICIEEADESLFWMELLVETNLVSEINLSDLMKETDELIAILTASAITVRNKLRKGQLNDQPCN